jgi:hypothetical protein
MTNPLPTIQLDQLFLELERTPTVLISGSGGYLPYVLWLEAHGAVLHVGAEFPGVTLREAYLDTILEVFRALPLDRPAIVHLELGASEAIPDVELLLAQRPANAALIVTCDDANGVDDRRFSAFADFEMRYLHGRCFTELRARRGFKFWNELDGNLDDDRDRMFEDEPWGER